MTQRQWRFFLLLSICFCFATVWVRQQILLGRYRLQELEQELNRLKLAQEQAQGRKMALLNDRTP